MRARPRRVIADTVWGFGATLTPDPDSQISIGYGHQNGFNSLNFNANYALTARTTLSASYYSTVQTQLQQIQSQLNLASINQNGTLVNSQTGQPIFLNNAALGVQSGLFETRTFSFTATTLLDRDQIAHRAIPGEQTGLFGARQHRQFRARHNRHDLVVASD